MFLIVGLGNPGLRYRDHRHNVGAQCASLFARRQGLAFRRSRGHCRVAEGEVAGAAVVVARPQTFVNDSGRAVQALLQSYRAKPQEIVVISDDLDLPLGQIRLRAKGSAGGHRGLDSIIRALGTQEFPRLRVGVGRPAEEEEPAAQSRRQVVAHVLDSFTAEEEAIMREARERAVAALVSLLTEGFDRAMNQFNR